MLSAWGTLPLRKPAAITIALVLFEFGGRAVWICCKW